LSIFFFSLSLSNFVIAQNTDLDADSLVQFSGVVVTSDSLRPVPFTHILVKNSRRGTVCDHLGYFSFVAHKSDTVLFSAVGYRRSFYPIPDTISGKRYSLIHAMTSDTLLLSETVIYPWPSREQFKEAFIKLDVPDDDLERARKNLAKAAIKERALNMPMDGSMNYRNYMQNQYSKLYYAGQVQPNNLLNPFAWAKFIEAWREGKLKLQK